jgi:hypothetical protein
MLTILAVAMLVVGLGALVTGSLPLGGGRHATGAGARLGGLFLMAGLPADFAAAQFIISQIQNGKMAPIEMGEAILIDVGIIAFCAAVGYGIAFLSTVGDGGRGRYSSDAEESGYGGGNLPVMRPSPGLGKGSKSSRRGITERPSPRKSRRREEDELEEADYADDDDDRDEDEDDRRSRRRRRRSGNGLVIGLSIGGGVLLLFIVILVVVLNSKDSPPDNPGAQVDNRRPRQPDPRRDDRRPLDRKPPVKDQINVEQPPPRDEKKEAIARLAENGPLPQGVLAAEPVQIEDLRVARFRVSTEQLVLCLLWAADGKSFYYLEKTGTLHRVSLDGFKELKVKNLAVECLWMSASSEGLLISTHKPNNSLITLVDPDTLEVKQTSTMPDGYRAVSARNLAGAYVGPGKDGLLTHSLGVLDLKANKYVANYQPQRNGPFPRDAGWGYPVMSPDGAYLFTVGGNNGIVRWKINGGQIACEQISADLVRGCNSRRMIQLSPDGKWVVMPTSVGNEPGGITHVFATDNLNAPKLSLKGGFPAWAVGFDTVAGRILAQDDTSPLIVHDANGNKLKSYRFHRENEDASVYLVHPDGRRVIILAQRGLYYVEMP